MKLVQVTVYLFFTIIIFACSPARKVQTGEVISKIDTTSVISVEGDKTIDSSELIRDVYNKVIKNKINFTTFNAKVRVAYNSKEENDEATAYIRLKKDSAMWLSLRGPLGIEGFRVLITKDSIKVMNLLKRNVQFYGIAYLEEITNLPLDFFTLQDIVVGNPVFIDSNIISYKTDSNSNNLLRILMAGKLFKNLVTIDNTDHKVVSSKLDEVDVAGNRTGYMSYSGYDNSAGVPFSTVRKISVAEQTKLDINLDFKQYSFNQPVTFPFNIPGNYKRL